MVPFVPAGVAGVERCRSPLESIEPDAFNGHAIAAVLDWNAESPHAGQRRRAIGAARIVVNFRAPFGDRGQHRVAMGYRFVAGQAHDAGKRIDR
jgi:hypothetical protein